ncbi:MAG: squalene synthase, partial [candidate division Zixibacteria bacterium]|nr:squalene synthase [candidate division Zixibacteria bacterium]
MNSYQDNGITSTYILNKVSRSFAKSIPMLDKNKIAEVENQYLLLRFLDTIEDSRNHSLEHKRELMDRFFEILTSDGNDGFDELVTEVRRDAIDDHDKVLVDNFGGVLNTFKSFEPEIQEISMECLREMGEGMLLFQKKKIKLFDDLNVYCRNFQDLNNYCDYVAGTVGRYLTRLVKVRDGIELDVKKAFNFGRYLQKVNIIKDFLKDMDELRCFWPSELSQDINPLRLINDPTAKGHRLQMLEQMIKEAMKEFKPTFDYILSIPRKRRLRGYLSFCLMAA